MKAKSILAYPGVLMSEYGWQGNRYIGCADALLAAGLVELHQLPGQPNNGKTLCTFYPSGSNVRKGTNDACKLPGYKQIKKVGNKFYVLIQQGLDEQEKRRAGMKAKIDAEIHNYRQNFTPPARPHRGHLRLVWSAPV